MVRVDPKGGVVVHDRFSRLAEFEIDHTAAVERVGIARPQLQGGFAVIECGLQVADDCARPTAVVEGFGILWIEPDDSVEVADRLGKGSVLGVKLATPGVGGGIVRTSRDLLVQLLNRWVRRACNRRNRR